jgi:prevent-host-death family protein
MKTASVAEMKSRFGAVLKASKTGPVVVTRNGRPVAVIVGVEDEDEDERLLMAYSPRLQPSSKSRDNRFAPGTWSAMPNSGRRWRRRAPGAVGRNECRTDGLCPRH